MPSGNRGAIIPSLNGPIQSFWPGQKQPWPQGVPGATARNRLGGAWQRPGSNLARQGHEGNGRFLDDQTSKPTGLSSAFPRPGLKQSGGSDRQKFQRPHSQQRREPLSLKCPTNEVEEMVSLLLTAEPPPQRKIRNKWPGFLSGREQEVSSRGCSRVPRQLR